MHAGPSSEDSSTESEAVSIRPAYDFPFASNLRPSAALRQLGRTPSSNPLQGLFSNHPSSIPRRRPTSHVGTRPIPSPIVRPLPSAPPPPPRPRPSTPSSIPRLRSSSNLGVATSPTALARSTPTPRGIAGVTATHTARSSSTILSTATLYTKFSAPSGGDVDSSARSKLKQAGKATWAQLEKALQVLEKGTGVFPPLKSAVSDFNACLHIIKAAIEDHGEQEKLASELKLMVDGLNEYANELSVEDLSGSISYIALSIEKQVQSIKARQDRSKAMRILDSAQDRDYVMRCYRNIESSFQQLQNNVNLRTLRNTSKQVELTLLQGMLPEEDARYNSNYSTMIERRGCTAETRQKVQAEIQDWVRDPGAARVYWMNGMAGTGKTTIAYSLCEWLERNKLLGANFFCSRTKDSCRDISRIVPTIACQLARYSPAFRSALCKVLEGDPGTSKLNVARQFEQLVRVPLIEVKGSIPDGIVIVIDALDECEDSHGVRLVLATLMRFVRGLPLKFFVASRPEPAILEKMLSSIDYSPTVLRLHDINLAIVEEDIKKYLAEALSPMNPFPTQEQINILAKRSGKLFIFAATAVRYILPNHGSANSTMRLNAMVASTTRVNKPGSNKQYQELDSLYATILASALNAEILEHEELEVMQLVLWTAVCAKEPMPVQALSNLLWITEKQVLSALQPLGSVLHVSEDSQLVSALHTSFPDYILDKSRSGKHHCNEIAHSHLLAGRCFDEMQKSLRFNICNIDSSFHFDREDPNLEERIKNSISPALFYACRYWGEHLRATDKSDLLHEKLLFFLSHQLLFWMEVLNLKQCMLAGEFVLIQAHEWLQVHQVLDDTQQQIADAQGFVTRFAASACTRSTPHIYLSALPFCPKGSTVYAHYWRRTIGLLDATGTAISRRGQAAIVTWVTQSNVKAVGFSRDSVHVASGMEDGSIRVWNAQTGDPLDGLFKGHKSSVNCVAFSLDSSHIVSGSDDRTIRVWGTRTGDSVAGPFRAGGHTGSVNCVSFSPDGLLIVSGSSDGVIQVWEMLTGEVIAGPFREQSDIVYSVAFSPDGTSIVSGSSDGTIRVWDAQSESIITGPLQGHILTVASIAFSPDGTRIISGSCDSMIRLWDAQTGAALNSPFKEPINNIKVVAFPSDGSRVVTGSDDGTIRVWDVRTGYVVAGPFAEHSDPISAIAFSPDGTRIVSGSLDHTIRVWSARTGDIFPRPVQECVGRTNPTLPSTPTDGSSSGSITPTAQTNAWNSEAATVPFKGHADSVSSVAFSYSGRYIISGSDDRSIKVWDALNGSIVPREFPGIMSPVNSIAISTDDTQVASGHKDGTIQVWNIDTENIQALVAKLQGHNTSVNCVAFSPGGLYVVSAYEDRTIRVWNPQSGTTTVSLIGHTGPVNSVAFSPDGSRIVSGSHDCTVRLWDSMTGGAVTEPLKGHKWAVNSVAFSLDGALIASGCRDGTMRVWDGYTGATVTQPFEAHEWSVNSVAFSPDGTCIVSGSYDCTVSVWDALTGKAIAGPFQGHSSPVRSVAFSPDSTRIISGSDDRSVRVWDASNISSRKPSREISLLSDTLDSNGTIVRDEWSFSEDGWISSNGKILFWISPDLHGVLPRPPHLLVIGPQGSVQFQDWNLSLGKCWTTCYMREMP